MIISCQLLNEVNALMIFWVKLEEQREDGSIIPRISNGA